MSTVRFARSSCVALLLLLAGCLQVNAPDGYILCSDVPGRACPVGYYCELVTRACYHNGDVPDLTPPAEDIDMASHFVRQDMSVPLDLSDVPSDVQDLSIPETD